MPTQGELEGETVLTVAARSVRRYKLLAWSVVVLFVLSQIVHGTIESYLAAAISDVKQVVTNQMVTIDVGDCARKLQAQFNDGLVDYLDAVSARDANAISDDRSHLRKITNAQRHVSRNNCPRVP